MAEEPDKPYRLTEEFYAAMGRALIGWNTVELRIDLMISVLHVKKRVRAVPKRTRLPHNFTSKTAFLREAAAHLPELHGLAPDIRQVTIRADALADTRNYLMHGLPNIVTPLPKGVILFEKTEFEKERIKRLKAKTSVLAITAFAQSARDLGQDAQKLVERMWPIYGIVIPPPPD